MTTIFTPLLTEYDPTETSEGSIDPLGLYPISDSLATKLIPGVRERQKHPRFLTVIAISLAVCGDFDDEIVVLFTEIIRTEGEINIRVKIMIIL